GDLAYEIDAREIPKEWSTGYVPFGRSSPFELPAPPADSISGVNLFHLNPGIVNWAVQFTKSHVTLPDDANLQSLRAQYTSFPNTQHPPQILKGAVRAAVELWIGAVMNDWAERWVAYWSDGKATFTTTSEEDAGFMQAMTFL